MNRWIARLWQEWLVESRRKIAPAFAKPDPASWRNDRVTVAWLGHATVLINFFGVNIITDPVLFPRIGIRIPPLFTIGPKRLTAPALSIHELPRIDVVLLSHAHFDHIDRRTLRHFDSSVRIVTAPRTRDLLRGMRSRQVTELNWRERKTLETAAGKIDIVACQINHWGARIRRDTYRGYNAYLIERNGPSSPQDESVRMADRTGIRRILFGADSALTGLFSDLRRYGPLDLAIMSIGCYNPWIRAHCTPEQAVRMANDAGAKYIMPVHHQTFRLSFEPFREPIERFEAALKDEPERIALREIGETFVLPL